MPEIKEGSFELDLGIVKLGAKLSEDDRQCAWELYTEIITRVAVVGKRRDPTCYDFSGELYIESLDSLYSFFRECRGIMRKFPVGKLKEFKQEHLGVLINRILNDVFRPFLEKWSGPFRARWVTVKDGKRVAVRDSESIPLLKRFHHRLDLRRIMRKVEQTLRDE